MYGVNIRLAGRRGGKVSNRERQQLAQQAIVASQKAMDAAYRVRLVLLGALAACGGEIVVHDDTLRAFDTKAVSLDYAIVEGANPGESIIRLLVSKKADSDLQIIRGSVDDESIAVGDTVLAQGNP